MKFNVTAVAMNRITRRQIGQPRTELIDPATNMLFTDCHTTALVEAAYESFWNDLNPNSAEIVKVIGVEAVR